MANLRRFFLLSCIIIVLLFSISCQNSATVDEDAYRIEAREKAMAAAIEIVDNYHYDRVITDSNTADFSSEYRSMLQAVYTEILPLYLQIYGITAR